MWIKQRNLQLTQTGLGHCVDGSVDASNDWWDENKNETT
jgi:hypothetical protein